MINDTLKVEIDIFELYLYAKATGTCAAALT